MASFQRLIIACSFLCMLSLSSYASWPTEVDSAIFVDFGIYPRVVVSEFDESVFVVYLMNGALHAKKYDRYGDPLWGGNRITLGDTTEMFGRFLTNLPKQWGAVVPDNSGGLFVSWQDYRDALYDEFTPITNDIYIQYVDSNGAIYMGPNGKRINTLRDEGHLLGDMKSDHKGGVFIGFSHDSTTAMSVLKRIESDGTILWETYFDETFIDVCAVNPEGNAFINLSTPSPGRRQKVDLSGTVLWPDTLIGRIPDNIGYDKGLALANETGGVYGITRTLTEVQYNRVFSDGNVAFEGNEVVPVSLAPCKFAPDGREGMYYQAVFADRPLNRIRRDGTLAWSDTVLICSDCFSILGIASDLQSGVIGVAATNKPTPGISFHAQRIDSTGQYLWGSNGHVVYSSTSDISGSAFSILPITEDGRGGIILNWVLNFQGLRIYMKQVSRNGILGEVLTDIAPQPSTVIQQPPYLMQNYPNPFNSTTNFEYYIHQSDKVELTIHNLLGQKVFTVVNERQYSGNYSVVFNASELSSGIYFYQLRINGVKTSTKKMLLLN
ncbi:MAG: T9SS type A sorting domain-containing protein [Calditrichia bacterium]